MRVRAQGPAFFAALVVLALFPPTAHALIVYESGTATDNSYNTTAPSNGAPWQYVAEVGTNNASAVYLGNDFLITAAHVTLTGSSSVELNGSSYFQDSSFTPLQIGPDALTIFKITGNPGLSPLALTGTADNDLNQAATLISWGVGKESVITHSGTDVGWTWSSDNSTRVERWGTNVTLGTYYVTGGVNYLQTAFNTSLGPNVASGANGDSGSGLFEYIGGTWTLAGILDGVDTDGASYYGNSPNNLSGEDYTYSVEVSQYSQQIQADIPEPRTIALLSLGLPLLWLYRRARCL